MSIGVSILATLCVGTLSTAGSKSLPVYFGTYTGGQSQGIYRSTLDLETGELSAPVLAAEAKNPSFLEIHPNGKFLYAVSEAGPAGTVSAYAIDAQTGSLKLLNQQPSGGSGPCHVNIDHTGKIALVANYGSGSASAIPIKPDGSLAEPTAVVQHEGSSVNPQRQKEPHAHSVNLSPDNRFAFVADLGIDKIMIYKLDAEKGTIVPNDPPFARLKAGAGPRHFAFHPNGRWCYSLQEEGSNIVLFDYDAAKGRLASRQTISSLPPGFAGSNFCSEILVSGDGRFVYAGNRLHDSIGIFSIGHTGELNFVGEEWTRGNYPRSFSFDPTGQFLYSCNQRADNVAVFRVDPNTGRLSFTGHYTPVGNPSIIVFVDLAKAG